MITVDKEKFTKMLEICQSISVADSPDGKPQSLRPLHAYVELKVENDKLKMSVFRENIDGYFYYEPEEIKEEEEGSKIVVQTQEILKIVRSRYPGIITITKEKNKDQEDLIIKQGSFKAKLRLYSDDVFSNFDFNADWKSMPKNVIRDLKACSVVSDTQTILMDIEGSEISLFAYTPVQLYYSLIELKNSGNSIGRKILAMNTVKIITSCFENMDDMEFSYKEEDEKFYIKSPIGSARFGLLYDDMPMHYKDNICIANLNKIKLDRKALLFIIESISNVLASWDQLILLTAYIEQKIVHLKVTNKDLPAEAQESLVIEETDLIDNFSIGIPSASVIKCLKNLGDSYVELYFSSNDKPLFIKGCESNFSVGFMPFRI